MVDSQLFVQRLIGLVLLSLISACSTTPSTPPPIVEIELPRTVEPAITLPVPDDVTIAEISKPAPTDKTVVPVSPNRIETQQRSNAVLALLNSADSAQQQGDFKSAQTTLQRAQRIAPRDPDVYYKLAVTHRDLEDYRLAEQVALKGVSLVQGQRSELRRFWLLIANIRLQAGDVIAADKAEAIASRY